VKDVTPDYPSAAKAAGVQGVVFVATTIHKDGSVGQVEAIRGPAELTDAAKNAVKQWRYEPATVDGKATEMPMTVGVKFSLDDTATAMSLIDALHDPNPGVRMTAMSMLSRESLGEAHDAAVRALKDLAAHDVEPAVRKAASGVVRRISK
jgi:TonB family protein